MRTVFLATALVLPAVALAQPGDRGTRPVASATDAARVKPRAAGWQGATQMFPYASGGLYQVTTAVGRVTTIMLQEGETLSDVGAVAAGDTVRWVIGEAASGTGRTRRAHILVKPTDPGLVTNLVINTDRRTYTIELRSTANTYMASVGWTYPQDELIAIRARAQAAEQVAATQVATAMDPTRLDFAYRLRGANPPWRPVQVFDDGAKTFILFPANVSQTELPPLFLIGERNEAELVNYRVSGRYMIIDRLFSRAELRIGTRRQEIVRIERTRAQEPQS